MREYVVDLAGVRERAALHARLREALPLPSWYGDNLDALYDALTEDADPARILFTGWGALAEADPGYFAGFRRVLSDVEKEIPGFAAVFDREGGEAGCGGAPAMAQEAQEAQDGEPGRNDVPALQEGEPGGEAVPASQEEPGGEAVPALQEREPGGETVPVAGSGEARTLIITDIHGCLDEARELLSKMRFDEASDTLICLGDTIDRGPQIYETFEYLRGLKERMGSRCILLRGNHEQMMLDAAAEGGRSKALWYYNSGEKTVYSFLHHKHRFQEFLDWYEEMPLYFQTDRFICTHASLLNPDPEKNEPETLLWGRSTDYEGKLVLTGHTPYRNPLYFKGEHYGRIQEDVWTVLPETGMIALDTGCVYGNRLTGLVIRGDGTFQAASVASGVR